MAIAESHQRGMECLTGNDHESHQVIIAGRATVDAQTKGSLDVGMRVTCAATVGSSALTNSPTGRP